MTGSVIDGEDILQSTLLKAFEALEQGALVSSVKAWLYRIAHNTALNHLRAQKRETPMTEEIQRSVEDMTTLPRASSVARF